MQKITFKGRRYSGFDPGTGNFVEVDGGTTVELSDEKVEQLMADFPRDWVLVETEKPEPEADDEPKKKKGRWK